MKYGSTAATILAGLGLASAGTVHNERMLQAREVPQEHSHNRFLDLVRTSLNTNNPKGIADPVFGLLGNAAAAGGAGRVTNLDCLQQETADQAFTNAKAAGDIPGMAGALLYRAIERNTAGVGKASVICSETATNAEIAAVTQHQDPASSGAAATNKAVVLALAKQLAAVGADPLLALETGTFTPGSTSDTTGKGNTCDTEADEPGCIFSQNLLVLDASVAEINAAVAGIKATVTGTGVIRATDINLAGLSVATGGGNAAGAAAAVATAAATADVNTAEASSAAACSVCLQSTVVVTMTRAKASSSSAAAATPAAASSSVCSQSTVVVTMTRAKASSSSAAAAAAPAAASSSVCSQSTVVITMTVSSAPSSTSAATSTCSVITTTVAAANAASSLATVNKAAAATNAATSTGTVNVNKFTGTLGAAAVPVESSAGSRPFSVNGDTFVNLAVAVQRACDLQRNACFDAANAGTLTGGTAQCDTQATACAAANAASAKMLRRASASKFGTCSDPTILFESGLDGRNTNAFIAADQTDFNHGSALNIAVIAGFICQRLQSSCNAAADVVSLCTSASAAAVATTQNQAAADAFNRIIGAGGAAAAAVATTTTPVVAAATAAASQVLTITQCS